MFDYTVIADNLGRSFGVITPTRLVWLAGFTRPNFHLPNSCVFKDYITQILQLHEIDEQTQDLISRIVFPPRGLNNLGKIPHQGLCKSLKCLMIFVSDAKHSDT